MQLACHCQQFPAGASALLRLHQGLGAMCAEDGGSKNSHRLFFLVNMPFAFLQQAQAASLRNVFGKK
jgi:hypothetical protein